MKKNLLFPMRFLAITSLLILSSCGGNNGGDSAALENAASNKSNSLTTGLPSSESNTQKGAVIVKPLMDVAIVGQQYENSVYVAPTDSSNEIVSLSISNPTAGGAQPTIDKTGKVTWIANSADFENTKRLQVTAKMKNGADIVLDTPVLVRNETLFYQVALGPDEASYSDPNGRYLVRVKRRNAAVAVTGTLKIYERFDSLGNLKWRMNINSSTAALDVLSSPIITPLTPNAARDQADFLAFTPPNDINLHPLTPLSLENKFMGLSRKGSKVALRTNVYSSRNDNNKTYTYLQNGESETVNPDEVEVFDFLANCNSELECKNLAQTKAPIILIHGFSGSDNVGYDGIEGGLSNTWGGLGRKLTAVGHPVFEMRWFTYMRFEEAAGQLAAFGKAVAEHTGKKPMVIAHSYGGVVAHLALAGKGITHHGVSWKEDGPSASNAFAKLYTLNSPLSGINYPKGNISTWPQKTNPVTGLIKWLTRGRDHTDTGLLVSIENCYAVTCLQAGAPFGFDNLELTYLRINTALIADKNLVVTNAWNSLPVITAPTLNELVWEGESIDRLQVALPSITVPVLKITGFNTLQTYSNDNNQLLGDGLISLIGQAADPAHFANTPYNFESKFGYKFISDVTLPTNKGTMKKFNALTIGECFDYTITQHRYYICAGAAHTGTTRNSTTDFSIANYNNTLDETAVDHPLRALIESTNEIRSTPISYTPIVAPKSEIKWRAFVTDAQGVKSYTNSGSAKIEIIRKTDGVVVRNYSTNFGFLGLGVPFLGDTYGSNVGYLLTQTLGAIPDLTQYRVRIQMGDDLRTRKWVHEVEDLTPLINLGDIDLNLNSATLVNISGKVINGLTEGATIPSADIWLSRGTDITAANLRLLANNNMARKLVSDSLGQFSVTGLLPGIYSVLVSKAGYNDQLQGRVSVAANGVFTFSLLPILNTGESSITLRWANASAGSLVSSDLDSHLIRLTKAVTPVIDYHIYYANTYYGATDSLDRDDITYEGPETITFIPSAMYNYSYYVHNYAGGVSTVPGSFPSVSLRVGGRLTNFNLPVSNNTSGRYWRVFDMVNGQIVRCVNNCLQDIAPSAVASISNSSDQVPELFRSVLDNLPSKR